MNLKFKDSSLFTIEGGGHKRNFRFVKAEVGTWPLTVSIMATEVQSGDLESATSSRLEVSIDGLTLSPDPEGERGRAEDGDPGPSGPGDEPPATGGDEDGETGTWAVEARWGFPLLELYGLGLKFFKGNPRVRTEPAGSEWLACC